MNRWVISGIALGLVALSVPLLMMSFKAEESVRFDESAIHVSANSGDLGNIDKALESSGHINILDGLGRTALHYSAENGHSQTSGALLERGANALIKDKAGDTALDLAKRNNHGQTAGVIARAMGVE
jgi:ankyrin repeat protein